MNDTTEHGTVDTAPVGEAPKKRRRGPNQPPLPSELVVSWGTNKSGEPHGPHSRRPGSRRAARLRNYQPGASVAQLRQSGLRDHQIRTDMEDGIIVLTEPAHHSHAA